MQSSIDVSTIDDNDISDILKKPGDITLNSIGNKIALVESVIIEFDNYMIRDSITKVHHNPKYHFKSEQVVIQKNHQQILNQKFDEIITHISSLDIKDQRKMWIIMFRYLFYVRNIRGEGKRERLLFYYLFEKMHVHYPKTVVALVSYIPEYGCFTDFNILITNFRKKGNSGNDVVNAIVTYYITSLNNDFIQISGKSINNVNIKEIFELNNIVIVMSRDEISSFMKDKKLSLAAKWFPRDKKKGSENHDLFIYQIFSKFCNKELKSSNPVLYNKRWNYYSEILRKVISVLSQYLCIQEQMMCTKPDTPTLISRDWSSINPTDIPTKAGNKYYKALLNQHLTQPSITIETKTTGNRSYRKDRIICRQKFIANFIDKHENRIDTDIYNLSKKIMNYIEINRVENTRNAIISEDLTKEKRSIINQQWCNLVKLNKDIIDKKYKSTYDSYFIDPKNTIPIIDTSGSIEDFYISYMAIGISLFLTTINKIPGIIISFSDKPTKIIIDLNKDIFDQFCQVLSVPIGLNTNIDTVYYLVQEIMVNHSVLNKNVTLFMLSFDNLEFNYDENNELFMPPYLIDNNIILWKMREISNECIDTKYINGVHVNFLSGFNKNLLENVLTGQLCKRLDKPLWIILNNSLQHDIFNPIVDTVLETQEGVFTQGVSTQEESTQEGQEVSTQGQEVSTQGQEVSTQERLEEVSTQERLEEVSTQEGLEEVSSQEGQKEVSSQEGLEEVSSQEGLEEVSTQEK
jgi:hypothetical protein